MPSLKQLKTAAAAIPIADGDAADAYSRNGQFLAAEVTSRLAARGDLEALIGAGNSETMADNHQKHALFVASMLQDYRPELFVETLVWVFRAYRARGFTTDYWRAQIAAWREVLPEILSPEQAGRIDPLYAWIVDNLDGLVELSEQILTPWEGKFPARGETR